MLSTYRQTGVSPISLMIGLLISMVALLGMMSLYGTVVKSTVESTRDARIAGERSSGLLVATMQLQGAGYGIDAATRSNDLLLLSGATLALDGASGSLSGGASVTGGGEGNTLIWRTRPDLLTAWCSGLHAPHSDEQGGLYLLQPQLCSALTETEWQVVRPLLIDNSDAVDARLPVSMALVDHGTSGCQVLGIAGAGQISVRLSTTDRNGNAVISSTCLLNFASGGTPP